MVQSRSGRFALLVTGHTFLALGVVGAFLPVMPTTVFLIVAASCYARASTRFYNRLVNHRVFGPIILDWRIHRAMSVRSKTIALSTIIVVFTITLVFFMSALWVRAIHTITGLALVGIILAIRTRYPETHGGK